MSHGPVSKEPRRNLVATAFAGLVLVLPLLGIQSSSGSGDPQGRKPVTSDGGAPSALELAQRPLAEAADRIAAAAEADSRSGFGGVRLDDSTSSVIVQWKGPLSSEVANLVDSLRSHGTRIEIVQAKHSMTELVEESRRIAGLDSAETGVKITGAGPLQDGSGILVSVEPHDLAQAPESLVSSFKLEFEAMPESMLVYHRWNDIQPFWAGAMMDHGNIFSGYDYCTSGFAATTSLGDEALITANHCGAKSWATPDGNRHMGLSVIGNASVDATTVIGEIMT